MNSLEMMAKAMMEKALANLPPEIMETIGQVGQIAVSLKAQLDRIENQNRLIIAHLNIPPETEAKELQNGPVRTGQPFQP